MPVIDAAVPVAHKNSSSKNLESSLLRNMVVLTLLSESEPRALFWNFPNFLHSYTL